MREILGWGGVAEGESRRGRSSGGYWEVVAPGRQSSMMSWVLGFVRDVCLLWKREIGLTRK